MERPNIVTCPNCGAGNKVGSNVCRMCATPLDQPALKPDVQPDVAATRVEEAHVSQSSNQQEATYPVDLQTINCPDCNAENELGWAFCQQCGHRLPQTRPAPPAPAPPAPAPAEPPIQKGIKTIPTVQPDPVPEKSFNTVEDESPAKVASTSAPTIIAEPMPPPPQPKPAIPPEEPQKPAPPPAQPAPPQSKPAAPPMTEQVKASAGGVKQGGAIACPQCAHRNEPGNAFCSNCGAVLTIAQTMVMSSISAPPKGKLRLVMEGGQEGESYDLSDETVIGRASGDITFPHDGFMSGRHARIERRGASFILIDEGSRNGTFIKLKGEVELKPGDMILIGKQLFRFEE